MAKILRSKKKMLNRHNNPVFFHLGDRKQEIFLAGPKQCTFYMPKDGNN